MRFYRVHALMSREFSELRRNLAAFVPVLLIAVGSVVLPLFIAIVIPALVGERLSDDADLRRAMEAAGRAGLVPEHLGAESAAQLFLLQQFLLFMTLIPVAGSMSFAAHSVVGEKQARTLEPLLATPVATTELLLSKVLAAILPSLGIMLVALGLYVVAVWWLARPDVIGALISVRAGMVVLLLGPLAGLVGLQLAVAVSARVNDPRSAQQIGVLVIVPVMAILVAQLAGFFLLTIPFVLLFAAVLAIAWVMLLALSVALFDREAILTRWK
jgi:ABC-2 type transport system permease protein